MRNRTYLVLMEQLVMVLVFAAAAAICLKIFVTAHQVSEQTEVLSEAALQAQNIAEQIKACSGEMESLFSENAWNEAEQSWEIWFDEKWQAAEQKKGNYRLTVREEKMEGSETAEYIGRAGIRVWRTADTETPVFEITVAWQEEN